MGKVINWILKRRHTRVCRTVANIDWFESWSRSCNHTSRLIIYGGAEIQSTEGTTESDNLAMSFYTLAIVEIQNRLRITVSEVKQVLLADDATEAGSLESLKKW